MTSPGTMPRRQRHSRRGCFIMLCGAALCAISLLSCEMHHLTFVHHVTSGGCTAANGQVTGRFSEGPPAASRRSKADDRVRPNAEDSAEAEARRLTVSIKKKAQSAKKLIEILGEAVDGPIFNFFHASAAYTQLETLKRRNGLRQSHWDSPVLLRLHARVQDMVLEGQLDARSSSNVLLSIAHLSNSFSIPTQLLVALTKSLPSKAQGMNAQDLSNNFWAIAVLKVAAPVVLQTVPAIAEHLPTKVADMIPQHLSNCLWASLQLADEAPEVLQVVPAIVQEIPANIEAMVPQALCNSLDALILHQESVPELASSLADSGSKDGIVRLAAVHLNTLLPELTGKDLNVAVPAVIWGCAKVGVYHSELLGSVTQRLGSRTKLSRLKDFGLCALSWAYQVLDIENDFTEFRELLKFETVRRGLSEADVESSRLGYLKWNRAKA